VFGWGVTRRGNTRQAVLAPTRGCHRAVHSGAGTAWPRPRRTLWPDTTRIQAFAVVSYRRLGTVVQGPGSCRPSLDGVLSRTLRRFESRSRPTPQAHSPNHASAVSFHGHFAQDTSQDRWDRGRWNRPLKQQRNARRRPGASERFAESSHLLHVADAGWTHAWRETGRPNP